MTGWRAKRLKRDFFGALPAGLAPFLARRRGKFTIWFHFYMRRTGVNLIMLRHHYRGGDNKKGAAMIAETPYPSRSGAGAAQSDVIYTSPCRPNSFAASF